MEEASQYDETRRHSRRPLIARTVRSLLPLPAIACFVLSLSAATGQRTPKEAA